MTSFLDIKRSKEFLSYALTNPGSNFIEQEVVLKLPLFAIDLKNQLDLVKIIEDLKNHSELYPTDFNKVNTSVKVQEGYRSSYKLHKEVDTFGHVIETILSNVENLQSTTESFVKNKRYYFSDFWGIIYKKSDYTTWHYHGCQSLLNDLVYNVVLYLNDNKNPLVIKQYNSDPIKIYPQEGLCIFMSPFLWHMVEENDNNERFVLAGNLVYDRDQ